MSSQHTLNFTHSASYEQIVYFVFLIIQRCLRVRPTLQGTGWWDQGRCPWSKCCRPSWSHIFIWSNGEWKTDFFQTWTRKFSLFQRDCCCGTWLQPRQRTPWSDRERGIVMHPAVVQPHVNNPIKSNHFNPVDNYVHLHTNSIKNWIILFIKVAFCFFKAPKSHHQSFFFMIDVLLKTNSCYFACSKVKPSRSSSVVSTVVDVRKIFGHETP